jgi:carbohydrate-binding DOMON domain-containing protein
MGSFSFDIAPLIGNNVLVVTSTAPNGGTAQVVRTVVNDVVEGTLLFDSTDPTGDDNGPGNYAYPTSSDFHAGAFDLTDFQVYDTGTTVTFRVQTRDLSPTFGSPLGAQLVDVYVHEPGASPTSTLASFPQRNYVIDPGVPGAGCSRSRASASGSSIPLIRTQSAPSRSALTRSRATSRSPWTRRHWAARRRLAGPSPWC